MFQAVGLDLSEKAEGNVNKQVLMDIRRLDKQLQTNQY